MYKIIGLTVLAALVKCEPPVSQNYHANGFNSQNSYLPPRTGFSSSNSFSPPTQYLPPTNSYLPPSDGYSGSNFGHHDHAGQSHGHDHENEVPKSYEFGYSVKDAKTGNDYDRKETSDGNVVRGEYRVQLPDGRTQIVTYHADWQTGFHADVRYEGEARYPEPVRAQGGYNYNAPDYSGSLTGFHGNGNSGHHQPSTAYGPPGYH